MLDYSEHSNWNKISCITSSFTVVDDKGKMFEISNAISGFAVALSVARRSVSEQFIMLPTKGSKTFPFQISWLY